MQASYSSSIFVLAGVLSSLGCSAASGDGAGDRTPFGAVDGSGAGASGAQGGAGASGAQGGAGASGDFGSSGTGGVGAAGTAANTGGGGALEEGDECSGVTAEAEAEFLPTDVIWAIDTTGTMAASFPAINSALATFSQKIIDAGIDAHIILVASGGTIGLGGTQPLCVPAPLGSGQCGAASTFGGPSADTLEPRFLHVDVPIGMSQGIPTVLDNYEHFKHMLRANARTQFVMTEDGAPLVAPAAVIDHIEGRTSATLGPAWVPGLTPGSYQWNGVICENGTGTAGCAFAFGLPQTTIDLAAQTQGLITNLDDAGKMGGSDPFAALLDKLAEQVIVGAKLSCDYAIPEPPQGVTFDREKVNVVYESNGASQVFGRASDENPCMEGLGWRYNDESAPTRVVLCPAACEHVQNDPTARIDIKFGCQSVILAPD